MVCGCDKDTEVKTHNIDVLTQKMFILQQSQQQQLFAIQKQLAAMPAQMDKAASNYFASVQDKALFYHTNSLYLLLAVEQRIQDQFQQAAAARDAANLLAYSYHTNTTDTVYFFANQMAGAMAGQEKKTVDDINAETRKLTEALGGELAAQIKQAAPDKTDSAKLKEMQAALQQIQPVLQQIQRDLDALKSRLNSTNPVPASP